MQWRTSISTIKDGNTVVRGKPIIELAKENSFAGNIYFVLTGKKPDVNIERMMNFMFSVCIDHGLGNASTLSARLAASTGASLEQSLIAAIANFGKLHGGATGEAAMWFGENIKNKTEAALAVSRSFEVGRKISGFGHRVLEIDERAQFLFEKAKELGFFGEHCKFAQAVELELEKIKSKKIPINIDGAVAAIALDMGFKPEICTGLFIIGRLGGLLAHVDEEISQREGLRRLEESEIKYEGV